RDGSPRLLTCQGLESPGIRGFVLGAALVAREDHCAVDGAVGEAAQTLGYDLLLHHHVSGRRSSENEGDDQRGDPLARGATAGRDADGHPVHKSSSMVCGGIITGRTAVVQCVVRYVRPPRQICSATPPR